MTIERLHYTLFFFSLFHSLTPHPFYKSKTPTGFTKSVPKLTKVISAFKKKRTTEDVLNLKLDLNSKAKRISLDKAPSMR